MRSPVLIQPPVVRPVSLEEAKRHCRVDHGDDDEMLDEIIEAAVGRLDGYSGSLGRALITQRWKMEAVPDRHGRIRFPFDPIQDVVSVVDRDARTADPSRYEMDMGVSGPWLVPMKGWRWHPSMPLTIEFVAGYGDEPTSVPADIRQAIRIDVEMQYDRPDGPRFEALRSQYRDLVRRSRRINI